MPLALCASRERAAEVVRASAIACVGTRIAFDTRTCPNSPRPHSWYTVDGHTLSRFATSPTVKNPCELVVSRFSKMDANRDDPWT